MVLVAGIDAVAQDAGQDVALDVAPAVRGHRALGAPHDELGLLAVVVALNFLQALQRSLADKRWPWFILTLAVACIIFIAPLAGLVWLLQDCWA